jgi:hypothetical protein
VKRSRGRPLVCVACRQLALSRGWYAPQPRKALAGLRFAALAATCGLPSEPAGKFAMVEWYAVRRHDPSPFVWSGPGESESFGSGGSGVTSMIGRV